MIVDLVVRTGVVVAVIMATKHFGVWDSPERTQEIYSSTSEHVEPYAENARRRMGFDPPQPPPEGKWKFFGVHYYNQVVISFFSLLSSVPELLGQGLELVPGYAIQMYQGARQQYEKYKEKSPDNTMKESCQRKCIDQTPSVVQPIEPDSHHCKRKDTPDKVIEPPPKKRFEDDFIYKSRLPSKEAKGNCNCTKCKRREGEGWSDNKPKCPNLAPTDNKTVNKEQPSKKKVCKLCPQKDSMETEKCKSEAETLKTCKKCLSNKEH
ncbi:uncharacterized protein Dwil_GK27743 [Drosophila willistoni]|uniref:uncharacterized protein LOC26529745 n=1 Tax=Drosophila willistoni TaxID=7260 RepID=UPI00073277A2|nr:uncharacterized protein LOC26529745 [Drosophila willistoni]KRF98005.1 uncharacterized protein Dwil_GK27743 [Drosophila willistoni]